MDLWKPSTERTHEEHRQRAEQFRLLAATARTADIQDALVELAEHYEGLAYHGPGRRDGLSVLTN